MWKITSLDFCIMIALFFQNAFGWCQHSTMVCAPRVRSIWIFNYSREKTNLPGKCLSCNNEWQQLNKILVGENRFVWEEKDTIFPTLYFNRISFFSSFIEKKKKKSSKMFIFFKFTFFYLIFFKIFVSPFPWCI